MKKLIVWIALAIFLMAGCSKKEEDVLHMGLNAKIVEIDLAEHIIYVSDMSGDSEKIFGEKSALDCTKAMERENIIFVNYENPNDVRTIAFEDLVVGDEVILNIYESELCNIDSTVTAETIIVEQIQLGTQRM